MSSLTLLLIVLILVDVPVFLFLAATVLGPVGSFATMFVSAAVGFWVAQRGLRSRLLYSANRGRKPSQLLLLIEWYFDRACGILLIVPGLLTDFLGVLFLFPSARRRLTPWISQRLKNRYPELRHVSGLEEDLRDVEPPPRERAPAAERRTGSASRTTPAPSASESVTRSHPVRDVDFEIYRGDSDSEDDD